MATYVKTIECGNSKYHISVSGENVYYSKSNRKGGSKVKGVSCKKNELVLNSTRKPVEDIELCEQIKKSTSSGCFITTVVCKGIGLEDDCEYLQTLRRFRDVQLLRTQAGKEKVQQYYQLAPELADKLEQLPEFCNITQKLFTQFVVPCCKFIRAKQFQKAEAHYQLFLQAVQALTK
ncbi:MAG: hypothetical protein CMK63_04770 [Pseudoalteromonadaceae bacterium]|nr:hypothetical protein [Pseudoalteromonadaceae bacterium]|tara:strand:- start:746 stop:1276 length:531 start_codon:yes stop_codon:yes gene_type:complete